MSDRPKQKPPPDYDPAAPLTDEEIKTLRPAREFFAERGLPVPVPVGRKKIKADKPKN